MLDTEYTNERNMLVLELTTEDLSVICSQRGMNGAILLYLETPENSYPVPNKPSYKQGNPNAKNGWIVGTASTNYNN